MPPMLGTKIIAAGAIRAIIWASWPAPDVMRFTATPRSRAAPSIRATMCRSKVTGSNRANLSTAIVTSSEAANSFR